MVDCAHPGSIITPGNFKFSLEPSSRCDLATNVLGYVPVATTDEIKRSPKGPRGQYGLGTGGVEWYCMICIQRMFDILDRQGLLSHLKGYHNGFQPLFAVAYWIEAETRTLPEYPGLFRPQSAFAYALEKWKAVKLYDQSQLHGSDCFATAPCDWDDFTLGDDMESIHLTQEKANLSPSFEDGNSAKIEAADVRGKRLSEVLIYTQLFVTEHLDWMRKGIPDLNTRSSRSISTRQHQPAVQRAETRKASTLLSRPTDVQSNEENNHSA